MTACTISSGPMRLSQKWHALHGEPSPSMSPRARRTGLAVRLRLSDVEEEAGNVIERLDPDRVTSLEDAGFGSHGSSATRWSTVTSQERRRGPALDPPLFPLAGARLPAFNAVAGRLGNKFTVQAVRP